MKIVTINVPDQYLNCLESMVLLGYFPSRSEGVRVAIEHFLSKELKMNSGFKKETFRNLKKVQMEAMSP